MERKVNRFPESVGPVTVEGVVMSNLGPAVPARIKSTMLCGIQAYL